MGFTQGNRTEMLETKPHIRELWCYSESPVEDLQERRECLLSSPGIVAYIYREEENSACITATDRN